MERPKRKLTVFDAILIFVIILTAALPIIFTKSDNTKAVISTAGGSMTVDLAADTAFILESNGYHFKISVSNGEIYVEESDCPDGICKNTRPVGKTNGSIVCLPAKLMITCGEEVSDSDVDAVVK